LIHFYKRKLYYELRVPRISIQPLGGSSQNSVFLLLYLTEFSILK